MASNKESVVMLILRCIHCGNYNSKYCKECMSEDNELAYLYYRERVKSFRTDISYEDVDGMKGDN